MLFSSQNSTMNLTKEIPLQLVVLCCSSQQETALAKKKETVPSERPTEGADRIGQHLAGVGTGVVRKTLAGRPVGDPSVSHVGPPRWSPNQSWVINQP